MSGRSTLRNLLEYIPARVLSSIVQCFPEQRNMATCSMVARAYAKISHRHLQRAYDNLSAAFPHQSHEWKQKVALESIEHLFQVAAVDALAMGRLIRPHTWHRHLDLSPAKKALPLLTSDRPVIMLTGHCGNWELLGYGLSVVGYPMAALARPLDNPFLNRWLLGIREAWGLEVLTKWGASPRMQEILSEGGRLGFIADQNAGDQGMFVPFFGRLASAYKSIGLLAMRFETPVIVAMARRRSQAVDYEVVIGDIIEPREWQDADDPLFYLTARYTRALETLVSACPSQYLWIHRRWKSRPRHVMRGRPMPESMAQRIHSLPWLTDDEAECLIEDSNREAAHAL